MGGVNRRDRESRPTSEFDSSELAALTKKPADEFEPFDLDEIDPPTVRVAAGTTPPDSKPSDGGTLARSRTTTAYDPLTTSLLAEVTRRTQTLDEDELEEELKRARAAEEAKATPTASPRLIRR